MTLFISAACSLQAQISVTGSGSTPETFGTQPPAATWSTKSIGADHEYTSEALMDAAVQMTNVTFITAQVGSSGANPPATSTIAQWCNLASGLFLQTRPTGNGATILMATLRNDSGATITGFTLEYDLTNALAAVNGELLAGHKIYYSLSGAANTWVAVGQYSTPSLTGIHESIPITLTGSWAANSMMYILWVDHDTATNPDGAYEIDNVALTSVLTAGGTCVGITNQTGNITVTERGTATFSISATGTPQNIYWQRSDNGGASYTTIPGANSPTYTIPSVVYPGDNGARFKALVSNSTCQVTSTAAILTVTPDNTPPTALSAVGAADLTTVTISFSEPVSNTSVPANYSVYLTGGNPNAGLATLSVMVSNVTNIVLTTDPRTSGQNYSVRIQNVTDTAATPNTISPNPTTLPVRSTIYVIDFDNDNVWKYSTQTNLFGTDPGWAATSYDDSGATWLSGPAALGVNTDANLNAVPIRTTTSYPSGSSMPQFFRRHFFLPSVASGTTLSMRYVFEDGGVVWINGQEAGRFNVGAGTLTAATRATVAYTEGTATVPPPVSGPVSLAATNLVEGDNVIAVAIIQNGTGSSDSILALELAAEIPAFASPSCPGITANPQNVTFTQCLSNSATFSITATGVISHYLWFRSDNGGASYAQIAGANSSTYTLSPAGPGDSGAKFFAIVTNTYCSATSTVATLTVTPDNTPPSVVYAVTYFSPTNFATNVYAPNNYSLTNIYIVFNEPVDTNTLGDVPGDLTLVDTNTGNQVNIISAAAPDNRTFRVDTETTLDPTHGYTLALDFIVDACAGNEMPHTVVPVYSFYSTPLALTATWKYLQDDANPGSAWFQPGFDDSAWLSGTGPFDMKRGANYPVAPSDCRSNTLYAMQGPVPTCLDRTNPATSQTNHIVYFRTHFTYNGNPSQTFLELSGKFDDGAAIYLNGTEISRIGIATGAAVTNGTPTTRTVGDTEGRDYATFLAAGSLHNGDNLIAVVLLQEAITSSDMTMGLELGAFTLSAVPASGGSGPHLFESINGNTFTITWSGGGTLQKSSDIGNPAAWTTIPDAASPFVTNNTAAAKQFFRVTVP